MSPLFSDLYNRILTERCDQCGGQLGIFDYGAGPIVRCEHACDMARWVDIQPVPIEDLPGLRIGAFGEKEAGDGE